MTLVEPWLASADPDFALFAVLARQPWPARPGAAYRPTPPKLFVLSPDRNARLWARLERDTAYQAAVQRIWMRAGRPGGSRPPGPPGAAPPAERQIDRAVRAVV